MGSTSQLNWPGPFVSVQNSPTSFSRKVLDATFPIMRAGTKHAAIVALSCLKEVLDISRDWEDKETKGQP